MRFDTTVAANVSRMNSMAFAKRRILIADDHALFRAGVRALLEDQTDWDVAGEAATGGEALRLMRDEEWDAVLLDISMPDRTGIDILRQIRPHKPNLPILILSMYPEDQYAVNLLRAGATGYLTKDTVPEQVIAALRTLLAGRKYISNEVAQLLANDVDGNGRPLHSTLSEREFQIFCKIAAGKSVGDIAAELHLSNKTISTYRARVLEKMNLSSNADLTYYAIKNGLIQ
jgi:DNA-binding NarL/FixJ family response regulator